MVKKTREKEKVNFKGSIEKILNRFTTNDEDSEKLRDMNDETKPHG